MPTGVYIRTEIYPRTEKQLKVLQENGIKFGFQKGNFPWNKGIKLSEEICRKMSEVRKGEKNSFYGKHHSEETLEKISKAMKGRHPITEFKKGSSGFKGHHTKETKQKIGLANKGKTKGAKNWNWKGGITPKNIKIRNSIETRLWRESVFARDNWTCQKYGIKGGKLHPHHIKNFAEYPELRFAIDNGITFSEKAHKEFHKMCGIKNNTKEQLDTFLKIIK